MHGIMMGFPKEWTIGSRQSQETALNLWRLALGEKVQKALEGTERQEKKNGCGCHSWHEVMGISSQCPGTRAEIPNDVL